jgi:oligopeptide/dipeptide ABC transporter ATP-binding protein
MYLELMEEASTDELFSMPFHPYTKALLSRLPSSNRPPKKNISFGRGYPPRSTR